jgi:hypothetical protein
MNKSSFCTYSLSNFAKASKLTFSWLERGLATGAIGILYKDEPVWDPIRSDPRFTGLLRRMGIP